MYDAIYALVNTLADNYGFDSDEGMEVIESWTPQNHIKILTDLIKVPKAKAEPKKEKEPEPKKEKEPEPKKEKEPEPKKEKEKRIKRMTPTLGTQLKTALSNVSIEMTDKLKKEFVAFIEALDDETWRSSGLTDHMRHFAESKAPKAEVESVSEKTGSTDLVVKTIDDLKKIELLTEVDTVGVFWDGDNGQFVTGPASDDDEDMVEFKFKGVDYIYGEKTGRVYKCEFDKDVFVGFRGVGQFK